MKALTARSLMACLLAATSFVPGMVQAQSAPDPSAPAQAAPPDDALFGDNAVRCRECEQEWQVNGRVSLEASNLSEQDLDPLTDDGIFRLSPTARLDVLYTPDDDIEVFGSLEASYDYQRQGGVKDDLVSLELRELYVLLDDFLAKDFQLQVGRQDVEDGREWLYDAKIDGVRVAYDHKAWRIEAMWGREELVRSDLLHGDPGRDKVDLWLFHAEYEVSDDWDVAAYVVKQNDLRASNLSPLTIGIQSEGRTGDFGHWLELAGQRGTAGARDIKAWAIDAGVIYYLPMPARPAIFAGYARGSGGGNATTSREFRQTGLQDNEDRITGLGNVRYYGEVLDPDLSNIEVLTLGVGIRPAAGLSVELIGHKYRQVVADDDDVRGSPISAELDGDDRRIGTELDLAVAARLTPSLALEGKLGWFRPGSGFAPNQEDALLAKVRLIMRF